MQKEDRECSRVWKEEPEIWRTAWRHTEEGKKDVTRVQRTKMRSL